MLLACQCQLQKHGCHGRVFQSTPECNINGVGSCELNGKVESFYVSVNGVGSVNARELIADDVVASLNGVGSVKLYAKNSLNASVNGIGGLTYFGNPAELILNDSGIGGITKGD